MFAAFVAVIAASAAAVLAASKSESDPVGSRDVLAQMGRCPQAAVLTGKKSV